MKINFLKLKKYLPKVSTVWFGLSIVLLSLFEWQVFFLWQRKTLLLLGLILMVIFGFFISFIKKYLPKLAPTVSIVVPGAICFSIYYFIFHKSININYHWFFLIWLCGILPAFLFVRSRLATIISFGLIFIWATLFFRFYDYGGMIFKLLALLCFCGFVFGLAKLASRNEKLRFFSRTWELLSFSLGSAVLITLAINVFDNHNYFDIAVYVYNSFFAHGFFLLLFYLVTLGILLYNFVSQTLVDKKFNTEGFLGFLAVGAPTILYLLIDNYFVTNSPYYFTVSYNNAIWLLFNISFVAFILGVILIGYVNKKMPTVFLGIFWLIIFWLSKFFNTFLQNIEFWQKYLFT